MEDATIWFARIKLVKQISAGFVLDLGSHMGHLGIIATGEENTYKQNTNGYFKTSSFRYDEDEAKSNRDNQEKSRAALQRYLFYCNR